MIFDGKVDGGGYRELIAVLLECQSVMADRLAVANGCKGKRGAVREIVRSQSGGRTRRQKEQAKIRRAMSELPSLIRRPGARGSSPEFGPNRSMSAGLCTQLVYNSTDSFFWELSSSYRRL
jgi:hypothetical protein